MFPVTQKVGAGLSSNQERRRSYRQTLVVKGMVYRDDNAASPQRVRLKNVSMGGVAFESTMAMEKGTRCRLVIELGPARLNWRVKVVCCGKMGESGYLVGGQFVTNELEPAGSADRDPSPSESLHIVD